MTVDCAITAVEEVAAARAAGLDVLVTDHHRPRADGALPDAPIVHPAISATRARTCARPASRTSSRRRCEAAAGATRAGHAADDLDLVALATVADCVPLVGENRRLVRAGLRALAGTAKPGPARAHARGPGRPERPRRARRSASAWRRGSTPPGACTAPTPALELVLTEDEARAAAVAEELDRANAERRDVETRILFAAEAQVARAGRARRPTCSPARTGTRA